MEILAPRPGRALRRPREVRAERAEVLPQPAPDPSSDVLGLWDPQGDTKAGEGSSREDASHADGHDLQRPMQKAPRRATSQEDLERCIEGEEATPGDGDGDA